MNNLAKLNNSKIYFFESGQESNNTNTLKEFIYFLKFIGHKTIDFSYSNDRETLHRNLNIKKNFELDAIPKSLIKDSENNLNDFLKQIRNPYLKDLIQDLGDLGKNINELSDKELKLTSIVKAILSTSNFIFLESPEKNLDNETLTKIKNCIHFESIEEDRTILIKSERRILWPDIVSNIVSKDEKFRFHNIKNPLNNSQNRSLQFSRSKKTNLKKVS